MVDKIIRGYWSCEYCGSKDIDGLVDKCPNCGMGKPIDIKYYMKGNSPSTIKKEDYLTKEELNRAGIEVEECDGNHKEWLCDYCGQLNNWSNTHCDSCGSSHEESTMEYGDKIDRDIDIDINENKQPKDKIDKNIILYKILQSMKFVLPIMVIIFLIGFLFYPIEEVKTVEKYSWERSVVIEEERTVKESDWSVPQGGRVYSQQSEIHHYKKVIDRYETVNETKTRQVIDHYETTYTYSDNGNGTFTQHEHRNPVYRTETYVEPKKKPVYKLEPVYKTKYYYEIDRYFDVKTYKSSGFDKKPYYRTDYKLKEKQRDTEKHAKYYLYFDDNDSIIMKYSEWKNVDIGDCMRVTTCRLGIVYNTTKLE